MKILYFTATGNCLDISRKLAANCGGAELLSIPQLIKNGVGSIEDDVIGVVFPVFACNLPAIVTRYLRSAKLSASYKVAVVAHGGGPGGIANLLAATDFGFDNIFLVSTWSNYLPFNPDRKPVATDVTAACQAISADVRARKTRQFTPDSSMAPFDPAPWAESSLTYQRRPDCINCGLCADICPVGNCQLTDGEYKFDNRCEACMACLQNCPTVALHMPNEPTRFRYRNPNITVEDIVAANTQK